MLQSKFDVVVKKEFPQAENIRDTAAQYIGKMQNEHGIDTSKIMMNTSMCADDTNMPAINAFNILFGPFVMGGLAGMPFTGLTGMTAYSHHIPDNGAAFIFYGPHIGITEEGELGKLCRPGMAKLGGSCGALLLALSRFKDPAYVPGNNPDDHQQMELERSLIGHREEILAAPSPIKRITEFAYENINKKVHELLDAVRSEFHVDKAVLLGGVLINVDYGVDDYFDVKNFEVVDLK